MSRSRSPIFPQRGSDEPQVSVNTFPLATASVVIA